MKYLIVIAICIVIGVVLYVTDEYWPGAGSAPLAKADSIHVEKGQRALTLYAKGSRIKTYRIALGCEPVGHKQFEGDQRTPEGLYRIEWRKENSSFYRALRISYPNATDRAFARSLNKQPGGDIMIHGSPRGLGQLGSFINAFDWTNGCIAVDNSSMAEIWSAIDVGTPILIVP